MNTEAEFRNRLHTGDSYFFHKRPGLRFSIGAPHPMAGTHRLEDINYYYQGFLMAEAGKTKAEMDANILGHNVFQAIERRSVGDIRQIKAAWEWANEGYDHYRRYKEKTR